MLRLGHANADDGGWKDGGERKAGQASPDYVEVVARFSLHLRQWVIGKTTTLDQAAPLGDGGMLDIILLQLSARSKLFSPTTTPLLPPLPLLALDLLFSLPWIDHYKLLFILLLPCEVLAQPVLGKR